MTISLEVVSSAEGVAAAIEQIAELTAGFDARLAAIEARAAAAAASGEDAATMSSSLSSRRASRHGWRPARRSQPQQSVARTPQRSSRSLSSRRAWR